MSDGEGKWGQKGRKTYSFHPEPARTIHHLEEVLILLRPEPVEASNFKVRPEMAHIVPLALHGLGVDIGKGASARFRPEDILRHRLLAIGVLGVVLGQILGFEGSTAIFGGAVLVKTFFRLDEHLP